MATRRIQIGVIGDSSCPEDQEQLAYDVGHAIGNANAILVCGGREGIMQAASHGCKDANGLVVGILPSTSRLEGNPYLDIQIPTGLGWTRNALVVLSSDVLIAIGGRSGTLNEMSYAWMYDKPVIALDHQAISETSWGRKLAGQAIDNRRDDKVWQTKTPQEAVSLAIKLAKKFWENPPVETKAKS